MAVLNRITIDKERLTAPDPWFLGLPAVAQLARDGLDLDPRVSVIVGENGSGKSTVVEAIAAKWASQLTANAKDWGPGGSREDTDLQWAIRLDADRPISHGGCFLRAEAMHAMFSAVDTSSTVQRTYGGALNQRSHGESFLSYLKSRLSEHGLFIFDEPEAALSFTSCLQLLVLIGTIADSGSQVVMATHSPLLAAFPGAAVLEFSADGITRREWQDLDLVAHWRSFLDQPGAYLRHLFEP